MTECCLRCSAPITQRSGIGRKKDYCSLACRRRNQRMRTTSVHVEHYNELRAMGGYPNECRGARSGGGYEALRQDLMNRRQLG